MERGAKRQEDPRSIRVVESRTPDNCLDKLKTTLNITILRSTTSQFFFLVSLSLAAGE